MCFNTTCLLSSTREYRLCLLFHIKENIPIWLKWQALNSGGVNFFHWKVICFRAEISRGAFTSTTSYKENFTNRHCHQPQNFFCNCNLRTKVGSLIKQDQYLAHSQNRGSQIGPHLWNLQFKKGFEFVGIPEFNLKGAAF